ncbi:hypothetical protein ACX28X_42410 [Streptomyces sp. SD18]
MRTWPVVSGSLVTLCVLVAPGPRLQACDAAMPVASSVAPTSLMPSADNWLVCPQRPPCASWTGRAAGCRNVRAAALRPATECAAALRSRGQAARSLTVVVSMADRREFPTAT